MEYLAPVDEMLFQLVLFDDDDKKDDHVHLLMRTPWFILHIVTCLMIITGNGRLLGWW